MSIRRVHAAAVVALLCAAGAACQPAPPLQAPSLDPRADEQRNIELVGTHELQGRESLQIVTLSDPSNGDWAYVGHLESFWDHKPKLNPLTGKMEWNGTSILDISNPAQPRLVWHIPNDGDRNSRSVSVVYDYPFDGSGHDYLIRNSEVLTQGETGNDLKYQIFDITDRATHPSAISLVGEITGTPPDSCGKGCGGKFIMRAHKGWWSRETGYFYAASGEPGFRNVVIQIFDLKNPRAPKFVGRAWLPGLKDGEPGYEGQYSHHPNVDEANKRLYVGYRNAGGQAAAFDISNPAKPTLVWSIDLKPPFRGPHTVSPIVYDTVPNFGPSALPRRYALVVDEAGAEDNAPCPGGVRSASYMLDITDESKPTPVSVWQVPVGNYCSKGGRFGPHQQAETVNGQINRFTDKLAWIAYFNAGIRLVDLADPLRPTEIGFYVPKPTPRTHPMEQGQPAVIQMNDVDLDRRGLAFATDRAGTGLFVFKFGGRR